MIYLHLHVADADFKEEEHPREESGQWTEGGGGGTKSDKIDTSYATSEESRQSLSDQITKKYELAPVKIHYDDLSGDYGMARGSGPNGITLNTAHFTPEGLKKYGKEWRGTSVGSDPDDTDKTAAAIIAHEIGHAAMSQVLQKGVKTGGPRSKAGKASSAWQHKVFDLVQDYYDRQNGKDVWPVSVYGQEDMYEFAAEAFAAMHLGGSADGGSEENREQALAHAKEFWNKMFGLLREGDA